MDIKVDMDKAQRVAYADTKHLGRPRWSELSVYYLPKPLTTGQRWVALSVGMSDREGEKPLVDKLVTFGLERALSLFDDSPIGRQVKAEARDWAEHNFGDDYDAGHPVAKLAGEAKPKFEGSTDLEALEWLFGDMPRAHMAKALGLNESTLRQQITGKGVRVSLLSVLPYIDRDAFRAAMGGENVG